MLWVLSNPNSRLNKVKKGIFKLLVKGLNHDFHQHDLPGGYFMLDFLAIYLRFI